MFPGVPPVICAAMMVTLPSECLTWTSVATLTVLGAPFLTTAWPEPAALVQVDVAPVTVTSPPAREKLATVAAALPGAELTVRPVAEVLSSASDQLASVALCGWPSEESTAGRAETLVPPEPARPYALSW